MIKLENLDVYGWEAAIRGMRNPMNSWDKSDTAWTNLFASEKPFIDFDDEGHVKVIGDNDLKLMKSLCSAGSDHRKFLRMINVTVDIIAPLYWWKEYDTYKVGTVANSCSTMHKIAAKPFELNDFSHDYISVSALDKDCFALATIIDALNFYRQFFVDTKDKRAWYKMIQLLPTSYNQRRTVQLNYEVLLNMYYARRAHKLDCWVNFCKWIETLPYFKEICGVE